MGRIDEWSVPVYARTGTPQPDRVVLPPGYKSLTQQIDEQLAELKPMPAIVHFYQSEGLRWIRVGYREDVLVDPSMAIEAGKAITLCMASAAQPLYFHAMRPRDLLFFVEGVDPDGQGMPAGFYGEPFAAMLVAWTKAWGASSGRAAGAAAVPAAPASPARNARRPRPAAS